jgi:hypothetical protein
VPRDSGRTGGAAQANTARRFPPPWSVEEQAACFVVRDHNGQQLAYVYFEEEPGRRSAAKLLTNDEARRIAGQYRQAAGLVAGSLSGANRLLQFRVGGVRVCEGGVLWRNPLVKLKRKIQYAAFCHCVHPFFLLHISFNGK